MNKSTPYILTLFTSISLFFSIHANGVWSEFQYELRIMNEIGPLPNQDVSVAIGSNNYDLQSDSLGIVQIPIMYSTECPSGKSFFGRMFLRSKWSSGTVHITINGKKDTIHKNWKRHFRKRNPRIDIYRFSV